MTKIFIILVILCLTLASYAEEPLFKVDTTVDKLPQEFYDLDNRLYRKDQNLPYEVVVVLLNDLGVGDDYGHTHEFKVVGATKLKNGIRLKVSYSTDLYTEKIGEKNEEGLTPQHFMDENIGKFMADNIEAGKFYYWKGEAGWNQLSDVYTGNIFSGSAQQIFFHKLINPFLPQKQPLNVSDGFGTKDGLVGGASIGLHHKFKRGPIELHPELEVGISRSTLKETNSSHASMSLESTYVISPKYRANLIVESEAKNHSLGTQVTHSIHANLEGRKWVAGAGVYLNKGTLDNHTKYNLPNSNGKIDPVYMFYGSYKFGPKSRNSDDNIVRPRELVVR